MTSPTLITPAHTAPRRRELLFGTVFATSGIVVLILTLVGAYSAARIAGGSEWLASNVIPLTQPNMQLAGLVLSVITMQWAVYAINNDDRANTYVALGVTILLGAAFVNQTIFLWKLAGITGAQPEGSLFYSVTGAHLAMVVAAIVFLVFVGFRALGGQYSSRNPDGIAAAAVLWDAAVALYVVIWVAVYIMK